MNVKFKIVCPLLFIALGIVMPACTDSDDEIGGNDTPPAGALPSAGFEPNNLPDEPYAEDAVLIVAEERYAPFHTLELMPDGSYLLTYNSYVHTSSVRVAANAGGSFSFRIRSISKKSVPQVSFEKPSFFPMIENAWQGKPPNKISKSGISFASILVMSPDGCSPKFAS